MAKYLVGERVRVLAYADDPRAVGCEGIVKGVPSGIQSLYAVALDTNSAGASIRGLMVHLFESEMEAVGTSGVPDVLTFGMSPERLGRGFKVFVERAYRRITGVGAQQYSNGTSQKFETMPIRELADMALEELEDLAVYAGMLHIRFQRIAAAIDNAALTDGSRK